MFISSQQIDKQREAYLKAPISKVWFFCTPIVFILFINTFIMIIGSSPLTLQYRNEWTKYFLEKNKWIYFSFPSFFALLWALKTSSKSIPESKNLLYDTRFVSYLIWIFASLDFLLVNSHRAYGIWSVGLREFITQMFNSPMKVAIFLDLRFIDFTIIMYFYRQRAMKGWIGLLFLIFFLPISVGDGLAILAFLTYSNGKYFVPTEDRTSSGIRGQKNYSWFWKFLIVSLLFNAIFLYIWSHFFIGYDFKTRFDYPVYIEEFSNIAGASMTYDVFLSVVVLHLLFLLEFLELGISSTYYVWMWIYFALGIFFGACSFGPLMFAHHEYLFQKYKRGEKANWKDQLLFAALTFLSIVVAIVFSFFPDNWRILFR